MRELSASGRELLRENLIMQHFDADTPIIRKGDQVSGAFIVLKGELRVFTLSKQGGEATLYTVAADETCIFALTCACRDMLYPAWVDTHTDTDVAIIPSEVFRSLHRTEPAMQRYVFDALAGLVHDFTLTMSQTLTADLQSCLADYLITHASGAGLIFASHEHIARDLGASRETISRLLGRFRDKGWIATGRGKIELLDTSPLVDLLEF